MPRKSPEISTGSMADIAFLLLIFFLVTTTIETDSGINRKLPPMEDQIDPPIIREKNMDKNDRIRHRVIMDLMSYESIDLNKFYNLNKISFAEYFKSELNRLKLIENEGFLIFNKQENKYRVTKTGEHFINNICHIFDGYQKYQYASHR